MTDVTLVPCPEWADKLAAMHPDDLTSSDHAELDEHIASCEACAAAYDDYRAMSALIRDLPAPEPPSKPLPQRLPQVLTSQKLDNKIQSSSSLLLMKKDMLAPPGNTFIRNATVRKRDFSQLPELASRIKVYLSWKRDLIVQKQATSYRDPSLLKGWAKWSIDQSNTRILQSAPPSELSGVDFLVTLPSYTDYALIVECKSQSPFEAYNSQVREFDYSKLRPTGVEGILCSLCRTESEKQEHEVMSFLVKMIATLSSQQQFTMLRSLIDGIDALNPLIDAFKARNLDITELASLLMVMANEKPPQISLALAQQSITQLYRQPSPASCWEIAHLFGEDLVDGKKTIHEVLGDLSKK